MDIPDQFEKIAFLFAYYGFVSVLKKMPGAAIPVIKEFRVAGKEAAHYFGKPCLGWTKEQVEVIWYERPGEAFRLGFNQEFCWPADKLSPVPIIREDISLLDAANHHVLKQAGYVDTSGPGHQ